MSPAHRKKLVASKIKGAASAKPSKSEPNGGPINEPKRASAVPIRPFAFSKCSLLTSEGRIVCAVLL